MAIQRDGTPAPNAGLDSLIEQFRAKEKRALIKRGVELWTRAEADWALAIPPREPSKIN